MLHKILTKLSTFFFNKTTRIQLKENKKMVHDAITIAKYVIQKSNEINHPVSNLQLQKILFYIQQEFLIKYKTPLFNDDFEAWRFGPVIPTVYRKYCGSAALPLTLYDEEDYSFIDSDSRQIIDRIIKEKSTMNPWTLVNDLHRSDKAWAIVYRNGDGLYDIIPKSLIKEKA